MLVSSRNAIIACEPVILHPQKSLANPIANRIIECSYHKRLLEKKCGILADRGPKSVPKIKKLPKVVGLGDSFNLFQQSPIKKEKGL